MTSSIPEAKSPAAGQRQRPLVMERLTGILLLLAGLFVLAVGRRR
jgi:uncharacterized membrane protein YdcZ (DUF606 family)